MRAKLLRQGPHRIVLRTGGDPQAAITFATCFRDQIPEQGAPTPRRRTEVSTLKAISGKPSRDCSAKIECRGNKRPPRASSPWSPIWRADKALPFFL